MNIRPKIFSTIVGLSAVIPAKAQKVAEAVTPVAKIERAAQDTVQISNKVTKDISLRTFQFLNGNNLTGMGAGIGTSYNKSNLYITPLAGYDFASKQPWIGGMGFIDRRYKNNPSKNVWLSQELYGEIVKEKGAFDSKIAYTPLKINSNIFKKISLSFDPRLAVHINGNGLTPQIETLTTFSGKIYKRLSGYALFQTYDTINLFKKGAKNNISVNGGIVYNFK